MEEDRGGQVGEDFPDRLSGDLELDLVRIIEGGPTVFTRSWERRFLALLTEQATAILQGEYQRPPDQRRSLPAVTVEAFAHAFKLLCAECHRETATLLQRVEQITEPLEVQVELRRILRERAKGWGDWGEGHCTGDC